MSRPKKSRQTGEAFKNLLKEKGYSQYRLAKETGVDQSTISKIANGETASPKLENLEKIAKVLGMSTDELLKIFTQSGVITELSSLPNVNSTGTSAQKEDSTDSTLRRNYQYLSGLPHQNLPPQHNEFIGRSQEICKLMEWLSPEIGANVITVEGIGGVGKTALIVEAGYRCLEYRDSIARDSIRIGSYHMTCDIPLFDVIIFTTAKESHLLPTGIAPIDNLEAERTCIEIVKTIAQVLDETILQGKPEEQKQQVRLKLREQRTLLIVDNLETIEDKQKVESFLYGLPPSTKSVITTREQLGYTTVHLPNLSESDGLQLIQQQLNEKSIHLNSQEQKQIYIATDGIPLAVIHTISRLKRSNSLETVLEELSSPDGDIVLFCFKKEVDDLKKYDAYKLLLSTAIFHSPPKPEAIIEVAGLATKPRSYVRKQLEMVEQFSLVYRHKSRYKMDALIREYVLAELSAEMEFKKEALNRWVNWYLEYGQKYKSECREERHSEYDYLGDEYNNFLAVLRWCKDEGRYRDVRDLWDCVNNYTNLRGFWEDRLFWLDWLVKEATRRGDYQTVARMKRRQGRTLLLMGEPEQLKKSEKFLLDAWELRDNIEFSEKDYIANHLAGLYSRLENYQEAHMWLDTEQKTLDEEFAGDPRNRIEFEIYINRERAEVFFYQNNYNESKLYCQKVIDQASLIANKRSKNYVQRILADIAVLEGEVEKAESLLKIGFEEVQLNKDKRRIAYYQHSFGLLEQAKGNLNKAREWGNNSLRGFTSLGMIRDARIVKAWLVSLEGV